MTPSDMTPEEARKSGVVLALGERLGQLVINTAPIHRGDLMLVATAMIEQVAMILAAWPVAEDRAGLLELCQGFLKESMEAQLAEVPDHVVNAFLDSKGTRPQ